MEKRKITSTLAAEIEKLGGTADAYTGSGFFSLDLSRPVRTNEKKMLSIASNLLRVIGESDARPGDFMVLVDSDSAGLFVKPMGMTETKWMAMKRYLKEKVKSSTKK